MQRLLGPCADVHHGHPAAARLGCAEAGIPASDGSLTKSYKQCNPVTYANLDENKTWIGFKIDQDLQGKGLITDALQASIIYVFKSINLHRIAANYMPRNLASAKVLEKCGNCVNFINGSVREK